MKQYIKSNRILLILLALAVAVSAAVIAVRWRAEADNKSYDIVLDYNELELLAEQSEHDVAWWLAQFRDMGITQVGLTEESLITLMENSPLAVTAAMMDEVIQDSDWAESYPAAFVQDIQRYGYDRFDVLVQVSGRDAAGFVVDAVERRFHSRDVVLLDQGEEAYILLNGTVNDTLYSAAASYYTTMNKGFVERREIQSSKLMYISLGLMPEKVETIQSLGMSIVPRTLCYNGRNDARYAQAVLEGYEKYGITPDYIIAGGEAAIGVIYSGEAIYTQRENADLEYVIPEEGTNVWIDSWVILKDSPNRENAEKFIDFMCRGDIAVKNFEYITYSTPNDAARELIEDEDIRNSEIAFPDLSEYNNLETFIYLGEDGDALYNELWKEVKSN